MILQLVTYAFLSLFLDDKTKDSAEKKFGASPLQRSFCSEARFELVRGRRLGISHDMLFHSDVSDFKVG